MIPLSYARPESVDAAVGAIATRGTDPQPVPSEAPVRLIAGGTNLTDLMKLQLMRPSQLVDINRLPLGRSPPTMRAVCVWVRSHAMPTPPITPRLRHATRC